MKLIALKLILSFAVITFAGCAGPQPRTTPAAVDNIDTKQIENQQSQQKLLNGVHVYPYKTNSAVTTIPIVTSIEASVTSTIDTTPVNSHKVISLPTPTTKSNVVHSVSSTYLRKTTTKPRPQNQSVKKTSTQLAIVTKSLSTIPKPITPVAALLQQAENQRATGDLVKAAATLERGVRIEPHNPHLWNKLARIRLEQGLFGQAQSMAAKSNSMASDSSQVLQENQQIISEANKRAKH